MKSIFLFQNNVLKFNLLMFTLNEVALIQYKGDIAKKDSIEPYLISTTTSSTPEQNAAQFC